MQDFLIKLLSGLLIIVCGLNAVVIERSRADSAQTCPPVRDKSYTRI